MSWDDAQREAVKWLAANGVPLGSLKGQYLNLSDRADSLPPKHGFRVMILRAAKRNVEKRGGRLWLPDLPEPRVGLTEEQ